MNKAEGRCTGHCCHSFSINMSPAELLAEAAKPDTDEHKEKDANLLATMLIYHGQFATNPLMKVKGESWSRKALAIGLKAEEEVRPRDQLMETNAGSRSFLDTRGSHWYGCRHIQLDGNCGIYETRPDMCRKYPNHGMECQFEECTMSTEEQKKHQEKYWPETVGRYKTVSLIGEKDLVKKVKKTRRKK